MKTEYYYGLAAITGALASFWWHSLCGAYEHLLLTVASLLVLLCVFGHIPFPLFMRALHHARFVGAVTIINTFILPFFSGMIVRALAFPEEIAVGFLLFTLAPGVTWFIAFLIDRAFLCALSTLLIPFSLASQAITLTIFLYYWQGIKVYYLSDHVLFNLIFYVVLPFLCAQALRMIVKDKYSMHELSIFTHKATVLSTCALLFLIFAHYAPLLYQPILHLVPVFAGLLLFFLAAYLTTRIAYLWGLFAAREAVIAYVATAARNGPFAMSLGLLLFPKAPLVCTIIALCMIVEIPYIVLLTRLHIEPSYKE